MSIPENEYAPVTDVQVRESFIYAQLHVRGRRTDEFDYAIARLFDSWLTAHDVGICASARVEYEIPGFDGTLDALNALTIRVTKEGTS